MLKNRYTDAEFQALPDEVKKWLEEDSRYKKAADGTWEAQTEAVATLKKSLDKKDTTLAEKDREIAALQAAAATFKDIDPEKAREALEKVGKLEQKKLVEKGDFDRALEAAETKYAKELKKHEDALAAEQSFTHKLLVVNGIRRGLTSGKGTDGKPVPTVKSGLLKAAEALIMATHEPYVIAVGDDRKAVVKIDGRERELRDWLPEWLAADEAKDFVEAPDNEGGQRDSETRPGGGGFLDKLDKATEIPEADRSRNIDDLAAGKVISAT